MWINSDLVVDLLDVVWITDQHVLVDKIRPEVAADRQRSLVLLVDPGPSAGGPELRLHAAGPGRTVLMFVQLTANVFRILARQLLISVSVTNPPVGLFCC